MAKEIEKNGYAKFAGLGFQMLGTIGVSIYAGYWLDGRLGMKFPAFTLSFALGSVVLSLYSVYKQVIKE